jgi:hypothetical protein
MYMCPILNGFQNTIISVTISKTVDEKEILYNLSHTSD